LKEAVTAEMVSTSTSVDAAVNCTEVWPEGIATDEGTVTFAAVLARAMLPLLLGALLSVTLQVEELPPLKVVGMHVILDI